MGDVVVYCVRNFLFFVFLLGVFPQKVGPNLRDWWELTPLGDPTLYLLQIPLLNTASLLASGVTVTWAPHGSMKIIRHHEIDYRFLYYNPNFSSLSNTHNNYYFRFSSNKPFLLKQKICIQFLIKLTI